MKLGHSALSQTLPSDEPERKVELTIEAVDGEHSVALRQSTWTEGLGWCVQKTIRLESGELDDLHRAIAIARQRLNRLRAVDGQPYETATVITLPTLA